MSNLKFGILADNQSIGKIKYKSGKILVFHKNGKVATGFISGKQSSNGKELFDGDRIEFHSNGTIKDLTRGEAFYLNKISQ